MKPRHRVVFLFRAVRSMSYLPIRMSLVATLLKLFQGELEKKDRTGISHESFLLMANSQSDMEEWVRAIRRVIWAPFGGGVFGQHLEETMLYEAQCGPQRLVPVLVEQCVCFIREHGLEEEGLFRAPGQTNHVRELQDAFDRGEKPVFDRFLDEVQSYSNENKMSVQNLATVFGPNILRPRVEDPVTMMEGSSQVQHLMTVLISEHAGLYQREEPETEIKIPPQQQQNTIQRKPTAPSPITTLEKGEDVQIEGKDESRTEEKADGKAESKSEEKGGSEVAISPSKQSKALPSWRCSFKGNAASGGPRGKIGGSAGDVSAAAGSNWLMNGLSSLRAHRRTTSSGERLKDSTLSLKDSTLSLKETTLSLKDSHRDSDEDSPQTSLSHRALLQSHRLSAYDNVAPSSLSLPADTSIWTSFEISLAEPEGSNKAVKLGQGQERSTEVRDSTNTLDNSASGWRSPVPKYQSQVNCLEEELDQEKKKFHMLEIRLRNSERAHQDAENRNILLQQEMEEFFKTLGDLTTGATRTN
ncbi:Rho GTPase-activating protein 24 Rho-type GTPase-activating protein 24 [Larimichthys crocea]|uniref:Rho GTPase-activating protein 24 Rho-type GTPase-activating protein 24 n=1 Tax=Larimichthys crocea TaxID=215358 RepID=A0A6G0HNP2_LARCR|nr:Rho GTPase-activating protein 24 Rho-type GTPase-activating protein 24 [Larimichthys crocea]